MAEGMCLKLVLALCAIVTFVAEIEAINDPTFEGIKTKTNRRNSYYAQQQPQQQQTHFTASNSYQTTTLDDTGVRLSPIYELPQQQQYQGSHYYQQELPLFERNSQERHATANVENAITEYYTGCPSHYTGQLPYAYDCRRFLNCWNGRGHIQSCGPGTVFNPDTMECDRPDKVVCGTLSALGGLEQQQKTPKYRSGRYLDAHTGNINALCPMGVSGLQPHPTDCTKFLNCANGNVHVQSCGPGTAYSIPMMVCDFKHKVDCSGRNVGGSGVGGGGGGGGGAYDQSQTGTHNNYASSYTKAASHSGPVACPAGAVGLLPHPYDCTKFLNCANGATVVQDCGPGTAFDSAKLVCDFKDKVSCVDRQGGELEVAYGWSQTNSQNHGFSQSGLQTGDILCPDGVTGLFTYPFDYTKFLNCKNGNTAIQSCIPGTVFSITKGFCELKDKVIYTEHVAYIVSEVNYEYSQTITTCPPATDGLHLYPFDCTKYIKCLHGQLLILECPPDSVFSLSKKICLSKREVQGTDRVKYLTEVMQQISRTTQSQQYNAESLQCPFGMTGLFPHPFDSTKYLSCISGRLVIDMCASGSVFSLSKKRCEARENVVANDKIQSSVELTHDWNLEGNYGYINYGEGTSNLYLTCPKNFNGKFLHPFDCTKYLLCERGKTRIESCSPGAVFSISSKQCTSRDQVEAYDRVEYLTETQHEFSTELEYSLNEQGAPTCPRGYDGLHPHPNDGHKYLDCTNGRTSIETCANGLLFSVSRRACDFEYNVGASDRSTYGRSDSSSATGTSYNSHTQGTWTAEADTQVGCPNGVSGMRAHPHDCTKFINCANGVAHIQDCGPGTAWSSEMEVCELKEKVNCDERTKYAGHAAGAAYTLRDLGLSRVQVTCPKDFNGFFLYPFDASKYISCLHGKLVVQACEEGKVFSFSRRACVLEAQVLVMDRVAYVRQFVLETTTIMTQQIGYIVCPATAIGYHIYPFDGATYVKCDIGHTHIESCASNSVFSISRKLCVSQNQVGKSDRINFFHEFLQSTRGQLREEDSDYGYDSVKISTHAESSLKCPKDGNGLFPHLFDCTKFLNCANGITHIQDCGPGTAFNVALKICDFKHNVDCSDRSGGLGEVSKTIGFSSAGGHNAAAVKCTAGSTGLQPHPFDCTKFLNCANGITYVQDCGTGTAWDTALETCVAIASANCAGGASTSSSSGSTYNYNNRDSKMYSSGGTQDGQWGQRETRPSEGSWSPSNQGQPQFQPNYYNSRPQSGGTNNMRTGGDRWSNMNFQRPTPDSYGSASAVENYGSNQHAESSSSSWSGSGSSIDRKTPGENVLYVEGSLQPNRNYAHSFTAPLAPMPSHSNTATSTTTNIYYAQPVGSQEDSEETFSNAGGVKSVTPTYTRQNHSREINYSNTGNTWTPITRPYSPQSHSANVPNQHLMPPHASTSGSANTPTTHLRPPLATDYQGQRPQEEAEYPTASNQYPAGNAGFVKPPPHASTSGRANTPTTHLMPPLETDQGQGQRPQEEAEYPTASNQYPAANAGVVKAPVGHLMPPLSTDAGQRPQQESDFDVSPSASRSRPTADASNLYGGLQPPLPTYAQSTTPPTTYNNDRRSISSYSPHAYPSTTTETSSTPRSQLNPPLYPTPSVVSGRPNTNVRTFQIYPPTSNANDPKYRDPHYSPSYSNVAHSRNATWLKTAGAQAPIREDTQLPTGNGVSPPPYNRQYYPPTNSFNPNAEPTVDDGNNQLPISEAIRMLLRPYFNRSGTVSEDVAEQAESHIMQLISTTTPRTTTTTTVSDVELILAGEQHSLTSVPTKEGTHQTSTDFHSNRDVKIETQDHTNWHTQSHSRDFHLRHPNLPNPYVEGERSSADPSHTKNSHHHHAHNNHHQHEHHNHQHSREFHLSHPNLPNPFAASGDENANENIPNINPNAEATTQVNSYLDIDIRSTQCQFDCGNGKCVQSFEVCDGVNNCGNRRDEEKCDHLGYKVRLTGGESSNMGRLEVQILGKWGYICDDKFGLRDADVACKELGFKLGASEVRGNSFYPPSEINFSFVMDEVDCRGNETSLKECNFKGWGVNNCGPDEIVGLVCKVPLLKCPNDYWLCSTSKECIPPAFVCDNTPDCADQSDESAQICNSPIEYRLAGGRNSNEGRLEVRYRGEWGTVCDDDFGTKEAQVMCNSLGYYGIPKIEKNIFGPGSGPIWLDQVSCFGNESAIDQCNHWTWGEHNCNHTEDVGLRCSVGPAPRKGATSSSTAPSISEEDTQQQVEDSQNALDAIGLYPLRQLERSSKFLDTQRRCGHFKPNIIDEYEHPEERVVNGTVAKRGRHPWQATIRTRGRGGVSSHWCGAVLISKKHLLTAAHCLAGYPKGAYFIRMGDHYANIAESSEIDSYIENWYIHEKFRDATHMNNDIALIVLKAQVRFNDYVQPVCLPEKGATLEENRMCTISGWGSIKSGVSTPSNILRAAQLPILADQTCKQTHVYGASMSEGMFCAGYMDENVDACDGDSGGPLICADDDGETLYGIISWGQHCGYANKPGVYVRVEKYIDWIYEKINFSLQNAG